VTTNGIMLAEPTGPVIEVRDCKHCFDNWMWVAVYDNDELLPECPADSHGRHMAFADIDRSRLVSLLLAPRVEGLPQIAVQVPPGAEPVLFRRRYVELQFSAGGAVGPNTIHCLGWEKNGVGAYTFAFEDGSILTTSDRNAV